MTVVKTSENGKFAINLQEILEIRAGHVSYGLEPDGDRFRYLVVVNTWDEIKDSIKPGDDLNFQFTRSGEAVRNMHLGKARDVFRKGGEVFGRIEGGFDPKSLSLRIIISRPPGHGIVVACDKGTPDTIGILPDEPADRETKVEPMTHARLRARGMLNLVEDEDVVGNWNLRLRDVPEPVLLVSPEFGRDRIVNNAEMQNAIMPAIFRRIVSELAIHPNEYENEPWAKNWRLFAAELAPGGRWEFYVGDEGEEFEPSEIEGKIEEGLEEYQRKHLPPLPKRKTAARYETNED
jgi:hypothetical protein